MQERDSGTITFSRHTHILSAILTLMTDSESLAKAFRSARDAVDAADLPADLRVAAFEKALATLLGDAPVSGPADPAGNGGSENPGEVAPAAKKVAARLRVDEHQVTRVLEFEDDAVHILVPRSSLPKAKSEAIQQVALLVAAGRQASGIDAEGWTHQRHIREATEVLGVDDHSNFAAHMKKLNGVRSQGSGKTGELKMNAVGFEAAGDLIRRLATEAEGK